MSIKSLTHNIKAEALQHYDKMISYAETRDENRKVTKYVMERDICETWHGKYCPYCKKYWTAKNKCGVCPLLGVQDDCCNGLWLKMNLQIYYEEWIIRAKEVRKYIEVNG